MRASANAEALYYPLKNNHDARNRVVLPASLTYKPNNGHSSLIQRLYFYICTTNFTIKMKKFLAIAALIILFTACSNDDSVNPLADTIALATQADVDAFANLGITATTKAVVIGPITQGAVSNITNLAGLSSLTAAQDIYIGNNPQLTNLNGLENLKKVNNTFFILNNSALTSLSALQSLTSVKALAVEQNKSLASLTGLEGLTVVPYISVSGNSNLLSLQGLNNLTTIEDKLVLADNALLPSLDGLDSLTKANLLYLSSPQITSISELADTNVQTLYIYNSKLVNLYGLSGLKSVYSITLQGNTFLESLNGLDNLTAIKILNINTNSSLRSLSSLASLTTIDGSTENVYNLQIFNNNSLTSLDGLQNAVTVNSRIAITSNPTLTNFCALTKMVADNGFNTSYFVVRDNLYNPTAQNISGGNCSTN